MATLEMDTITELLKPVELPPLAENPLVSVLVANYNYGRFIAEAIESVLAQTYPNFEMIICDDGSTDESCDVVERYTQLDPRIKLLRRKNGGMASAQNAAYSKSSGQIVCLLDSDDRFLTDKLEKVVSGFRSTPDGGCLSHQMFRTDKRGRRLGVSPWIVQPPDGWYGPFVVRNGDIPPGLAFGSGVCLRREIAGLIFPLPAGFTRNTDGAIMVWAPFITRLIGIPLPLTEYRCHGENDWNAAEFNPEILHREVEVGRTLWKLRKEYLDKLDPRLGAIFPSFEQRLSTLCANYIHERLQKSDSALKAYLNLVRSPQFRILHLGARLFWRLSILLPLPLFRYGVNLTTKPNRLKQMLWWIFKYVPGEAQRRFFPNRACESK